MAKRAAKAVRHENPLMPDERLRQIYTAMVQVRMLEEFRRAKARGRKGSQDVETMRGEEAARASTVLSLGAGDLISDCSNAVGMDRLLGATLNDLKRRPSGMPGKPAAAEREDTPVRRLPPAKTGGRQLQMGAGAAAALKLQRSGRVLLIFVRAGEVSDRQWKRTLSVAGQQVLPMIVIVLPNSKLDGADDVGSLASQSRRWGVPGFPVDGSDAIALYRVMQESLLRARSDDGPALIECIAFDTGGGSRKHREDPIDRLRDLLLRKGVADEVWLERTRSQFARRLGTSTVKAPRRKRA